MKMINKIPLPVFSAPMLIMKYLNNGKAAKMETNSIVVDLILTLNKGTIKYKME